MIDFKKIRDGKESSTEHTVIYADSQSEAEAEFYKRHPADTVIVVSVRER